MIKIFISGSITIKYLDENVSQRLKNIVDSNYSILVGDAGGVDSLVQNFLKHQNVRSVVVYCSGENPRNNIGGWAISTVPAAGKPGTREYFTAKDRVMADDCDYGLMVWDGSSTGTLSNVIELISRGKSSLVYLNKAKQFIKLKNPENIDYLLEFMSNTALKKADAKIGLLGKINSIKIKQSDLFGRQLNISDDSNSLALL